MFCPLITIRTMLSEAKNAPKAQSCIAIPAWFTHKFVAIMLKCLKSRKLLLRKKVLKSHNLYDLIRTSVKVGIIT